MTEKQLYQDWAKAFKDAKPASGQLVKIRVDGLDNKVTDKQIANFLASSAKNLTALSKKYRKFGVPSWAIPMVVGALESQILLREETDEIKTVTEIIKETFEEALNQETPEETSETEETSEPEVEVIEDESDQPE